MNTAHSDTAAEQDGAPDAADDAAKACRFAWYDGHSGHICTKVGPHDRHYCSTDQKYHDPTLKIIAGDDGRPKAVHR